MKEYLLTKKQRELMELFWEAGIPLSKAEILERAARSPQSWKTNSLPVLLSSLTNIGALRITGLYFPSRKLGRKLGRIYEPALSLAEYERRQAQNEMPTAKREAAARNLQRRQAENGLPERSEK